jgi:EAL domain-containing protein (putative c-di-GMP-specific phosphodiesterase class I)
MYHAKDGGGDSYRFYSESMNASALDRLSLEGELRTALERDQLRLFYQPQVRVSTGQVVGAEALMRWQHPTRGLVSPAEFIPLAEETGLIVPMGAWALRTACAQAAAWRRSAWGAPRVAVNVSGRQFLEPDFVDLVARTLAEHALPPGCLEIEVTESLLMGDAQQSIASLTAIKALGVRLSVDDFGTGYSSLSYLSRFPLDTLKIDRSFLRGVPQDAEHVAITTAISAMARGLRLSIIAEGVETEEQLKFVADQGCDEFQGYLRSPPIPAEQFLEFLPPIH